MLRRLFIILFLVMLGTTSLTGCYTMGKVTGEAAEEVEEGADDFEHGYKEGKQ